MSYLLLAVGFVLGFCAGAAFRDTLDVLWQRYRHKKEDVTEQSVIKPGQVSLAVLIAVVAVQAVVGVLLMTTKAELSRTVECQADYNQKFSVAYKHRYDAAQDTARGVDAIFFSVAIALASDDPADSVAFRKSLQDYVDARKAQVASAEDNPPPPLPNMYCGS